MNGWDKAVTFPLNSPRKAHLCPLNGFLKWSAMSNLTAMIFWKHAGIHKKTITTSYMT